MAEIAAISLKTLRTSLNVRSSGSFVDKTLTFVQPVLLRFHALVALRKSLTTAGWAATDSIIKDVLKQAKSALGDKALPLQRAATDVSIQPSDKCLKDANSSQILIILYPSGDGNRSVAGVESIAIACTKSLDNADQETRQELSRLVGHVLASMQTAKAAPPPDTTPHVHDTTCRVLPSPATCLVYTTAYPQPPPRLNHRRLPPVHNHPVPLLRFIACIATLPGTPTEVCVSYF